MPYFEVPVIMRIEALDEHRALGAAEVTAFAATMRVRQANNAGGYVTDSVTHFRVSGKPKQIEKLEKLPSYDKKALTDVFGEESAIRILNSYMREG